MLQHSIFLNINILLKLTTHIVMLLQALLQFCNNVGLVATFGIIVLFCLLLHG